MAQARLRQWRRGRADSRGSAPTNRQKKQK
jgi:hypothetical protein